jgi:hypothetical protein
MNTCQVSIPLAILATVYIIASCYYVIRTRSLGTPFSDAVSKYPDLVAIKQKSAGARARIFYEGVVFAIIVLIGYKLLK